MHIVQLIPLATGTKPRAQLTKRKSFEEKAQESASRLEAPEPPRGISQWKTLGFDNDEMVIPINGDSMVKWWVNSHNGYSHQWHGIFFSEF